MKFPLSWLREFVDCNQSPSQIARLLTSAGIEVDEVEPSSLLFRGVVVAYVSAVAPHPQADKLQIATVFDGAETHQVVCGAPNCRAGIKTAFARIDAVLSDPSGKSFTIKKTMLRGIESNGMLCSSKELGIGIDHDGIIEFEEHLPLGADVSELYADHFFSVSLTPNLGHCASILGIARELAALTGSKLLYKSVDLGGSVEPSNPLVNLSVEAIDLCPRYAARIIRQVTIAPSPLWLQKRIEACGLRPVNNVVDITNFVLMELGQPLHAFDLSKIAQDTVVVRKAKAGEILVTLDGKERKLFEEDLLICDAEKPMAIAGVMGGAESEVTEATRDILLESAYFSPQAIRAASKRHALSSEASRHFEKGVDPNALFAALDRAALLIEQICGAAIDMAPLYYSHNDFERCEVICSTDRINSLLGLQLGQSDIEAILTRLNFAVEAQEAKKLRVLVPTYRHDVRREVDLIEEVARLYGYDKFDAPAQAAQPSTLPHGALFGFERKVRDLLIKEGMQEMITCDLISEKQAKIDDDLYPSAIKVMNPSSIEQSILRTGLLPGFLQVAAYNCARQNFAMAGFEIGRVYFKEKERFKEKNVLALLLMGKKESDHWSEGDGEWDFYDLKGIIENLFDGLSIPSVEFMPAKRKEETLHPGRQATIVVKGFQQQEEISIGMMGEVHPTWLRKEDVTKRILFAEIDLDAILQLPKKPVVMEPLPLYPAMERVWTVTVPNDLLMATFLKEVEKVKSPLLEGKAFVQGIYRSEKLGPDKKNITLRFTYRSDKKTLEQEAVDKEFQQLTAAVSQALNL
jgi:phenylalanyl-tRNA synthetase beta chain